MSMFSGKCDLYDSVEMIHCGAKDEDEQAKNVEEFLKDATFYIWNNDRRLKLDIKTRKDLALYYPYLLTMSCYSGGKFVGVLSSDSFIDREEKERIDLAYKIAANLYKKYKRKKKPFIADEVIEENSYGFMSDYEKEIIRRFEKYGKKADISDMHTKMHEYYRKEWYQELIRLGWSEDEAFSWVYKTLFSTEEEKRKRLNN